MAVNFVYYSSTQNDNEYLGKKLSGDSLATYVAEVVELPIAREKTIRCNLKVLSLKTGSRFQPARGNIIAYFRKSARAERIEAGQVLVCKAKINALEDPKNPFEFDYKAYMANKQVHHSSFIDSSSFFVSDIQPTTSEAWLYGLRVKRYILSALKASSLSLEAVAICEALLTGYTLDIDRSVMDAFAHSGTLHVLSVSGLHTGLIFLFLSFLFDLFDGQKRHKKSKFFFITISLWLFALLTGFSAPVLRAVIMFNLLGAGRLFFRNTSGNQINILFVSAFILLLYDPFLLFDIGFQLSYSAMLGIFIFMPLFKKLYVPHNKVLDYIAESVAVSFAATIITLPFTLYYFKQFPLWFFACNLVVVPATFALLLLAFLVVLEVPVVALIINALTSFVIWFINIFDNVGTGFIANIHFEKTDAFFLCFLVMFISLAVYLRSYRYCAFALLILIAWQTNNIFISAHIKNERTFTVYHIRKESAVSVKDKGIVAVQRRSLASYNYHVLPHIVSFNYPGLSLRDFNYVNSGNEEIITLSKVNCWPGVEREKITTVVVCNNFKLNNADMIAMRRLKRVVCDGSNNKYVVQKTMELCRQMRVDFYSTSQSGACLLSL